MAAEPSSNKPDDINSLNKRVTKLNDELTKLMTKEKQRGVVLTWSENRRIEKLQETINKLKLERHSILKNTYKTPSSSSIDGDKKFQDCAWNEEKEGSFALAKDKQILLKAYYDNFPNIDDVINEKRSNVEEVKEFTKSILQHLPSGDLSDKTTACHIINNLLKNRNIQCLFFDSTTHRTNLYDAFENLAEIDLEDRPFVLKLNSSTGLGGNIAPKTEHGAIRFAQTLTNAIEQEKSDPIIEDILARLAKVHEIDKKCISIKTVYVGTFNVVYTVKDLADRVVQSLTKITRKLKDQFEQFLSAKIHPLLYRASFDISVFDKRGNRTFLSQPTSYQVGPPGKTQVYTTPAGWTRYGLKVLGKYVDGDHWLHPFQHSGNWYRAFHGTGRATVADINNPEQSFGPQDASVEAVANIIKTEFRPARVAAYGPGVYCSSNPTFPERGFVRAVEVDTQKGKKNFICMLQVGVNPNGVQFTLNKDIWVVPNPKDIRPYGILIKET